MRFSYLVDFLALESLKNIYLYSVQELEQKIRSLVDLPSESDVVSRDVQAKGGEATDPLFHIMLEHNFEPIEERYIEVELLKDFVPPPIGNSQDKDFNILYHVRLVRPKAKKRVKKEGETGDDQGDDVEGEDLGDDGANNDNAGENEPVNVFEDKMYERKVVPRITELWLKLSPDRETFTRDLMRCVVEGLNSIQAFERWSRHDDMTRYVSVLEEWDDMVGDDWEHPEQTTLNPVSWLDGAPMEMF